MFTPDMTAFLLEELLWETTYSWGRHRTQRRTGSPTHPIAVKLQQLAVPSIMSLTYGEVRELLAIMSWETIEDRDRTRRTQHETSGYREGLAGQIQATLSILLEAKESQR